MMLDRLERDNTPQHQCCGIGFDYPIDNQMLGSYPLHGHRMFAGNPQLEEGD
jgi:hypothetical protein